MGQCSGLRIAIAIMVLISMVLIFLVGALIVGIFASAGYNWAVWGEGLYWIGGVVFMGYLTYLIGFSCEQTKKDKGVSDGQRPSLPVSDSPTGQ